MLHSVDFAKAREQILQDWGWDEIVKRFGLTHKRRSTGTIIIRCLFHVEKTPSLVLSKKSGRFKCYGCGKGGDPFEFLLLFLRPVSLDDLLLKLGAPYRLDILGQSIFSFVA